MTTNTPKADTGDRCSPKIKTASSTPTTGSGEINSPDALAGTRLDPLVPQPVGVPAAPHAQIQQRQYHSDAPVHGITLRQSKRKRQAHQRCGGNGNRCECRCADACNQPLRRTHSGTKPAPASNTSRQPNQPTSPPSSAPPAISSATQANAAAPHIQW